jgi:hypothetical protein
MRSARAVVLLTVATVTCLPITDCGGAKRADPHLRSTVKPDILRKYKLVESKLHRELLVASIHLANTLLGLDTKYQLAPSDDSAEGRIPVYLVAGDNLGEREYAFSIQGEHCIVINADRISQLVRRFGSEYDDRTVVERHPPYGVYPPQQDYARKVLAIVLMHEVGHLWQENHGSYSGSPSVSYAEIMSTSGETRSIELAADKFCADRLRRGHELVQAFHDNPGKFVANRTLSGARLRDVSEFEGFVFYALMKVGPRKPFAGMMPVSHLDFDLRLLIYWQISYGEGEIGDLILGEISSRRAEDQFLVAWDHVMSAAPPSAKLDRYYPYIQLLRSPDMTIRNQAGLALRREEPHSDSILPVMIDSLNEKYGEIDGGIAYSLATFGRRAVPDLIRSLESSNSRVRYNAVFCLLAMGPKNNAGALPAVRKLINDSDEDVRTTALKVLRDHEPRKR